MLFVPRVPIYERNLLASSVPEPDAGEVAWSPTEINAVGDERYIGAVTASVTISNGAPCVVTWPTPHNVVAGKPLSFATAGTLPAGLVAGQIYFVKEILSPTTHTISDSLDGGEINTTTAGAGVHTCTVEIHAIFEAQAGARSAVTITQANPGVVNWPGHGRTPGEAVVLTTSGALPGTLAAGTTYYVKTVQDPDNFTISATPTGAAISTAASAGSGTHVCGLASNYNKPPLTNDIVWLYLRPTNRWALFDESLETATTAPEILTFTVAPGFVDSLGALEVDAAQFELSCYVPGVGVVFEFSRYLQNGVTVGDWWEYYHLPIVGEKKVVLPQLLPLASDCQVTITLRRPGGTVSIAAALVGQAVDLGGTMRKPRVKIRELSDGGAVKQINLQVRVAPGNEDNVDRYLTDLKGVPGLFIGDGAYQSLIEYGTYEDWDLSLDPPVNSVLDLQVKSLTLSAP